jgi:hypothetical protein
VGATVTKDYEFNWDAPVTGSDENADWLKTLSWGGLPETGPEFMEYMNWYNKSRHEQREEVEEFMRTFRAEHMPKAVRQYFVDLGLLD